MVVIPDDISAIAPPAADLRAVVRSAAQLKEFAPQTVSIVDPLVFSGCDDRGSAEPVPAGGPLSRARALRGPRSAGVRQVHPVTMWKQRLTVALDALHSHSITEAAVRRTGPVETTNVQLPTGDRLQIPTAAETIRMKSYLVLCRNSRADFTDLADLADAMGVDNAALALGGIDRYYSAGRSERLWLATQLVRRLADPLPSDGNGGPEWDDTRQRCLSLSVAILEEAS